MQSTHLGWMPLDTNQKSLTKIVDKPLKTEYGMTGKYEIPGGHRVWGVCTSFRLFPKPQQVLTEKTGKLSQVGPSCCRPRKVVEQFCGRSKKLQLDLSLLSPIEAKKPQSVEGKHTKHDCPRALVKTHCTWVKATKAEKNQGGTRLLYTGPKIQLGQRQEN